MEKDINSMTAEELSEAVPQIGKKRADQIVKYRDENGEFDSMEDLKAVPGLSQGMIENIKQAGIMVGGEKGGSEDME